MKQKYLLAAVLVGIFLFSSGIVVNSKASAVGESGTGKVFSIINPVINIPICLNRGEIPKDENHWLYIPTDPNELATNEHLGFFSGKLIQAGLVDASSCPWGGLWGNGYANPCGLDASSDVAYYLQNVYDDEILDQVDEVGVPPVLIKRLIRYESQFWPGSVGINSFGLGHVANVGAYNALQWNSGLYREVCINTYRHSCNYGFVQAPADVKALLAGKLLELMNADCSECEYTVDIEKAEKSIDYIAKVLMGYCRQTSQIVVNATGVNPNLIMDYATIWKLSVYSYNWGPSCLYNALISSYDKVKKDATEEMNWGLVSSFLNSSECVQGKIYVENITRPYYYFPFPQDFSKNSSIIN